MAKETTYEEIARDLKNRVAVFFCIELGELC